MFYFENRKQEEIAELLGMSLSNVKVTILRTKEKLQTMLKGAYSLLG
jgi:RNA polymerase sigma factor (sigma-70 family)